MPGMAISRTKQCVRSRDSEARNSSAAPKACSFSTKEPEQSGRTLTRGEFLHVDQTLHDREAGLSSPTSRAYVIGVKQRPIFVYQCAHVRTAERLTATDTMVQCAGRRNT